MSIFAQIEALAHEQQNLWREASHKRLKDDKRQRLTTIRRELAALWHLHRCELAAAGRGEWRQTTKARGANPDALQWTKGDLDSFSVNDMQSILRIEYKQLRRRGFATLDQEFAVERQAVDGAVNADMQAEFNENRRIQKVVTALVGKPKAEPKPFNPHNMSLRELRQHRLQPHREFPLVGTL